MTTKSILLALALLIIINLLKAQSKPDTSRFRRSVMNTHNLREDKIKVILASSQRQIAMMSQNNSLSVEEKKVQFKRLIEQRRLRLDSLLTPEEKIQRQKRLPDVYSRTGSQPVKEREIEADRIRHKHNSVSGKDTAIVH